MLTVVGRVDRLAYVADLGRDLCTWDDTSGHLELDGREVVLREARAVAATAAHGHRDERRWRSSWSHGLIAITRQALVTKFGHCPVVFLWADPM